MTLLVVILSAACSLPSIPQRDPLLPVPVRRPEIEVDADRAPEVLDERSVLKFTGRLSDRFDPGGAGEDSGGFSRVALVFELEPDVPSPDATPDMATLRLSAPYGNLPRLRLGATYEVRWEVVEDDPLGMPDLRIEIRSEEGRLLYMMTTGAALPEEPLMEGLELRSARVPVFLTDFEAGGGCRVRRRHYTTQVRQSLETGETWLMPTDVLYLHMETGTWRLTVLDNSVALKGGCDRLIAQELAHRTIVLQFVE